MNEIQIRKRNFVALVAEGTFFYIGMAFIDVNAVIPVFIFTYTQSLKLAGLATTINLAASVICQTLVGPYIKSIKNVPAYITRLMFIFRPLTLMMVPVLFSSLDPLAIVLIFLGIYALLFGGDGLVVVPWTDLFGRTILQENRGKLLGYQQLFGGIGSLAAGFLIKFVLEYAGISNAVRYSIIFSCAAAALIVSALAMMLARDLPHPVSALPAKNWHYYAQMPACLKKNPAFVRLAVIKILSSFTGMIAPFLILYGKGLFDLDASQVSTLIYIQICGGLCGGILWGMVSSRFGNKYVIRTSLITGLLIPVYAISFILFTNLSFSWYLLLPLILANGMNMGSWVGFLNYTIDIVSEEDRTVYLLLSNLITFPLTILAFLAGIIADIAGFVPLFCISILSASTAVFLSRRLKSRRQLSEPD